MSQWVTYQDAIAWICLRDWARVAEFRDLPTGYKMSHAAHLTSFRFDRYGKDQAEAKKAEIRAFLNESDAALDAQGVELPAVISESNDPLLRLDIFMTLHGLSHTPLDKAIAGVSVALESGAIRAVGQKSPNSMSEDIPAYQWASMSVEMGGKDAFAILSSDWNRTPRWLELQFSRAELMAKWPAPTIKANTSGKSLELAVQELVAQLTEEGKTLSQKRAEQEIKKRLGVVSLARGRFLTAWRNARPSEWATPGRPRNKP